MPGSGSPTNCGTDISGTGFVTSYSDNLASHTTTITEGGQQRVFQADSTGRPIYMSEPERGVTRYSYSYNSTGLQIVRTRPQANQSSASVVTTTTTQLDSIGRIIAISYVNGNSGLYATPTKTFTYDTLSNPWWGAALGYSKGRLVLTSAGGSETQIGGYDALGDPGNTVQCLPDWCGQTSHDVLHWYFYDLRGLQRQEEYMTNGSSGTTVSLNTGRSLSGDLLYLSGGQNNVSALTDPNGKPILVNVTQPGPFGLVSGQFGNDLGVAATYDTLGRLQSGWVCSDGVASPNCPGASRVYDFSSLSWTGGYLTSSTDSGLGYSSSYSYDQFGRLSGTNIANGQIVFSYGYDRWGCR